jgi:hypothetical protein
MIILPRQARDKHGKSQKRTPFVQVDVDAIAPADDGEGPVAAQSTGEKTHLLRHFYTKKRSIHQDRLGTNIGKVEKKRAALSYRARSQRTSLQTSPHTAWWLFVCTSCRTCTERFS